MVLAGLFIISGAYLSDKGRQTLKLVDCEEGEKLKVSLRDVVLDDATVSSKAPIQLQFDGVSMQTFDGRSWLSASTVHQAAARAPKS